MKSILFIFLITVIYSLGMPTAFAVDKNSPIFSANADKNDSLNANKAIGSQTIKVADLAKKSSKGLIYCLAVFLIALAVKNKLRQRPENNNNKSINILARKAITAKSSLLLVTVENQKLLLAQNGDSLALISEMNSFAPYLAEKLSASGENPDQEQPIMQVVKK
ncbi:MAG: FliO/MopB family protein [Deltaproteobacteria bacterium]|nr:FliO/MopB family protein [Deltaproteobacteria bacterium]